MGHRAGRLALDPARRAAGPALSAARRPPLFNAPSVSFRFLKDHLRLSDSDLSKQMATLESAGYVTTTKDGRGYGRRAYGTHCAALRALLDGWG
ncbi:transcriptional regulator [Micromonospora sp. NPDC002296]|uniref:transcriptional regulator n=1 Tax=Micromonospora sp. NPDC002296 TaxID=3154271 RepID=UPI00331CE0D8